MVERRRIVSACAKKFGEAGGPNTGIIRSRGSSRARSGMLTRLKDLDGDGYHCRSDYPADHDFGKRLHNLLHLQGRKKWLT